MRGVQNIRHRIDVPFATLLKGVAVVAAVWAISKLWPLILLFGVSLMLAVTLEPFVRRATRRGVRRGLALAALTLLVFAAFASFVGLLLPAVGREIAGVASEFPKLQHRLDQWTARSPSLERLVQQIQRIPQQADLTKQLKDPGVWEAVASGALAVPLVLIVALYLVADGPRVYAWLLAYVPRKHRPRMAQTASEVAGVVHAYVRGQLITSGLVAVFSYVSLKVLGVQAPLALALLAGVFDVVPFIGFIAFTVPAVLMALTVSPTTALIVLVMYAGYHLLENYFIVPRVYGRQMRLSTLTVLISLGVGGALSGVIGAILVLPIVAAYPIVERHWLRQQIGEDSVEDHVALDEAIDEKDQGTVKRVIKGEDEPDARH